METFLLGKSVVAVDPGYPLEEADVLFENVAAGEWIIAQFLKNEKGISILAVPAFHREDPSALEWKVKIPFAVSDCGIYGLFDTEHYHDDKVVPQGQEWTFPSGPAAPEFLWYSFVCERSKHTKTYGVIPGGLFVRWDRSVEVSVATDKKQIVGFKIRLFQRKEN